MTAAQSNQPVVTLQGLDRSYRYTGSYDQVRLGPMPLEHLERLIDYVASLKYLPNYSESDLCPASIFIEAWGASLELYYDGRGGFDVRVIDNVSSTDMFIAKGADPPKVKDFVRRFTSSRQGVDEILGPEPLRKYFITVMGKECDPSDPDLCWDVSGTREVSREAVIGIPAYLITSLRLRRGGLMRKPELIITYYGRTGEHREARYRLSNKQEYTKAVRILSMLFPDKVSQA